MKKLLFAIPVILLAAAGCNQSPVQPSSPSSSTNHNSENTTTTQNSTVSGGKQIVNQKNATWNGQKYTITQYCEGSVRDEKIEVNGTYSGQMSAPFCIGTNTLTLEHNGIEIKINEQKVDSVERALGLDFALGNGKPFITKNGDLLMEYAADACLTNSDCGVGQPTYVNLDISLNKDSARELNNFPEAWFGDPIWNPAQTRAVFYPVTGGAGCDTGPIIGYDLLKDKMVTTSQTACGALGDGELTGTDTSGNTKENGWTNLHWDNDTQASVKLNLAKGGSQVVKLDFSK
jgi:hypothetical protein